MVLFSLQFLAFEDFPSSPLPPTSAVHLKRGLSSFTQNCLCFLTGKHSGYLVLCWWKGKSCSAKIWDLERRAVLVPDEDESQWDGAQAPGSADVPHLQTLLPEHRSSRPRGFHSFVPRSQHSTWHIISAL